MTTGSARWYWRRLRCMSVVEVGRRAADEARRRRWVGRQVTPAGRGAAHVPSGPRDRRFTRPLPLDLAAIVPEPARQDLLVVADSLMEGRMEVLGVERSDLVAPDWFVDPTTGGRAPAERLCFSIQHRAPEVTGNVKQVWELSRHQHLSVLACAWYVSDEDRYAERVDAQLRDWWAANPNLSGIHWTSGIELALRLIAWTWIRRLLDGWPGIADLFEENDDARRQIAWHQQYLDCFRSTGTSANNHVIAEAAGQLTAACAFPWFDQSERWRGRAAALLERELVRNTFPSGVNRELASDYHGFVLELGLVAALEAEAAGHGLSRAAWATLRCGADAAAALVDQRGMPPRQGDGDDGRAVALEPRTSGPWDAVLATAAGVFGRQGWWPSTPSNVTGTLLPALAVAPGGLGCRPSRRPSHFADAGITLLRTPAAEQPEIWCRADAGPHGFLAIAAHAHADALSVEVRYGGVNVLADPGTYCYHDELEWRAYFRSTFGHNTVELAGADQSQTGGPFLWVGQAESRLRHLEVDAGGEVLVWGAEHDGYERLEPPARHRRTVRLDRASHHVEIQDTILVAGPIACRMAYHLGPEVRVALSACVANLDWSSNGRNGSALLELPYGLTWAVHQGETDPIVGWYSPGFSRKEPSVTLVGTSTLSPGEARLTTELRFDP